MKYLKIISLFLFTTFFFIACEDDVNTNPITGGKSVYVSTSTTVDTATVDTTITDSTASSNILVSDTTVKITKSAGKKIITTTISDTTYLRSTNVESTYTFYYLTYTTITDSIFTPGDSIISDTAITSDTITLISTLEHGVPTVFDTTYSETTIVDTQLFTTYVVASTSDYKTGNVSLLNVNDSTIKTNLLAIHSDNAVMSYNSSTYICERLGADNIIRVDGTNISSATIKYQSNIGSGVNVHTITPVSETKAYITQYGADNLIVFNPKTGKKTGSIFLTDYVHKGEKVPNMESAILVGDNLYVMCQRLKTVQGQYGPYMTTGDETGIIVVISTLTDMVTSEIALLGKNPASMDTAGGYLFVSCTGSWFDGKDGDIEKIDLTTNKNSGIVVSESLFVDNGIAGNIGKLVMVSPTKGYVAVSRSDFATSKFWTDAVPVDFTTGKPGVKVQGIENAFGGLATDGVYLYVGDRGTTAPGILVVDVATDAVVKGPFNTGLPPNSLAILTVDN